MSATCPEAPARRFLCRDCLAQTIAGPDSTPQRCATCRSPRLLWHAEGHELTIAHVDCDAFYASIEKRDRPELQSRPVIVGGGRRGVVSTCCYVARTFGVRSAMPMFRALKLCPEAVVIKPDMEKYAREGRAIRERMRALTPLVEPLSIDEAFLDLSGTQALHGAPPIQVLARLARDIERDIGVTVSVGLAPNKFLAKIASELEKPRGFSIVGRAEAKTFLAPRPITTIWGIGEKSRQRYEAEGIRTIGDLTRIGVAELARRHGAEGLRLFRLAEGEDARKVTPERETKSISSETTFDTDIADFRALEPILWRLCEKLAERLARADLATTSVTLKLKTVDFRTITRAKSGLAPTRLAIRLHETARLMLRDEANGRAFRLIGVGTGAFRPAEEADRGDLIDTGLKREVAAAEAMARLRARFGAQTISRGVGLAPDDPKGKPRR